MEKLTFFALLEKGKTYEFSIGGDGSREVQWSITKASVKAVEEGTEYTTTEEETPVYDFVPSKSGEYMFSSKDGGTGKVYSSDWKEIDGYWYNGAVEFGVKVSLEQGKTTASGVHDNTLSWDYYLKTIKADGKFYDVLINVRNTGKDQFVYDVSLKGKKTEPPSSTRSTLGQGDSVSTTVQDRGAIVKKKFQLKDPVEETGTLIAAHNLTEDKLKKMLEYDGIPMPSIAITKADQGWNKFGDISLIFRKETIDPAGNRKNKVYGADAWTPTFPQIENDINEDVYYRASRNVDKTMTGKMPDYLKQEAKRFIQTQSGDAEHNGVDGVVEAAKNDIGMKAAYLASKRESG